MAKILAHLTNILGFSGHIPYEIESNAEHSSNLMLKCTEIIVSLYFKFDENRAHTSII